MILTLTLMLHWLHFSLWACEYVVCRSAKWYWEIVEKNSWFERILELLFTIRLHDIQLVKAYYIFVL